MNSLTEIKRRLARVINNEMALTEKELKEFGQKKYEESQMWGVGGNYRRYEKCEEARQDHLEELKALEKVIYHGANRTEKLRLYPWACPSCQMVVYMEDQRSRTGGGSEIIDCPICQRTLYRSGNYTEWETVAGSKRTEVRQW